MKKILIAMAIAATALLPACNKIKQLATINIDIPFNQQFTVPQVAGDTFGVALPPGGATLAFPTVAFATNSQQDFADYNTSANKLVNVYLSSLALQILSTPSQNFNFLDSVEVYISAPSQPEALVAYQYNVPKGQPTLNLNTITDVNLKNYFIQDTIYFRLSAHINAVPVTGSRLNMSSVFQLVADQLD